MSELRAIIREILEQELAAVKIKSSNTKAHEEQVSINTNQELANFVARIIKLSENTKLKKKLLDGEYVFKLADESAANQSEVQCRQNSNHSQSNTVQINKGLITEKEVKKLPDDLAVITIGKTVRFTPLASDELRRRRIKIERSTS